MSTFKGYCPSCNQGMLIQTQVKMAAKIGDNFFISDNRHHYECMVCGACIATEDAMELMLFSSMAIKEESDQSESTTEERLYIQNNV